MPINKPGSTSSFEVKVERFGFLGWTRKTVLEKRVALEKNERVVLPLSLGLEPTRLIIKHDEDGGSRVKIDCYPPINGNIVDDLIYQMRTRLERLNKMESTSNINFACSGITTDLEVPMIFGFLRTRIRRLT